MNVLSPRAGKPRAATRPADAQSVELTLSCPRIDTSSSTPFNTQLTPRLLPPAPKAMHLLVRPRSFTYYFNSSFTPLPPSRSPAHASIRSCSSYSAKVNILPTAEHFLVSCSLTILASLFHPPYLFLYNPLHYSGYHPCQLLVVMKLNHPSHIIVSGPLAQPKPSLYLVYSKPVTSTHFVLAFSISIPNGNKNMITC